MHDCSHQPGMTVWCCLQVLQLQSASSSPESQPVDYESGIEAMILAILQQTNYSQQTELADLSSVALQITQDDLVADNFLVTAYSNYLAAALAANANLTSLVETSLLNISSTSVLPVSDAMLSTCLLVHCCHFELGVLPLLLFEFEGCKTCNMLALCVYGVLQYLIGRNTLPWCNMGSALCFCLTPYSLTEIKPSVSLPAR